MAVRRGGGPLPSEGERGAHDVDDLSRTLYDEIRRMAAVQLRGERARRSICATDLAHEAMARALRQRAAENVTRAELLRRVSRLCRQVLVDRARARGRLKRDSGRRRVPLESLDPIEERVDAFDIVALDEALVRLAELNERHAQVVELRFFGGSSMTEVAEALGISLSAAEKDWRKARAWLALALEEATE